MLPVSMPINILLAGRRSISECSQPTRNDIDSRNGDRDLIYNSCMDVPSQNFYADLPAVGGFEGILNAELYRPFPDDWHVVIADVRDSTGAIGAGRYKDVNLIGASAIIAALNACKG